MTNLISRSQWGADNVVLERMPKRPVNTVFLHHTAIKFSGDGAKDMRNIEAGEQSQGYSTVAYHEVGMPDGRVYEGRGVKHLGAATKNNNSTSLAYCLQGNFQTDIPSMVALEACAQRLAQWVRDGAVTKDFVLRSHSDVFATACCGKNLKPHIAGIRERVDHILAGGNPAGPEGVIVTKFLVFDTSVGTDNEGRGYVDVYHGQGVDPRVSVAQVNGTNNKPTYPDLGEPVFFTAGFEGNFVRVTVVGAKPKKGFGIKVLMGW